MMSSYCLTGRSQRSQRSKCSDRFECLKPPQENDAVIKSPTNMYRQKHRSEPAMLQGATPTFNPGLCKVPPGLRFNGMTQQEFDAMQEEKQEEALALSAARRRNKKPK
jgi:hypothetical protein